MNHSRDLMGIAIIVVILAILYASNPKEHQLQGHLKHCLKDEAIDQGGLGGAIEEIFAGPQSWLMSLTTERHDCYIFSIYTVGGLEREHKYLGILGTFILLPEN
jgi:hypothetical protein